MRPLIKGESLNKQITSQYSQTQTVFKLKLIYLAEALVFTWLIEQSPLLKDVCKCYEGMDTYTDR